jgi:YD repeat-containing protein
LGKTRPGPQQDYNGLLKTFVYDLLSRPTSVTEGNGASALRLTTTQYEDGNLRVVMESHPINSGDPTLITVTDYDQLGRVRLSRQVDSGLGADADDDTKGIKVQARYLNVPGATNPSCAGPAGLSYRLVSNPYQAANSSQATGESTMGWTLTTLDSNGRATRVETFSGTALPSPWGSNPASTGAITTCYSAETTTITDQNQVSRTNVQDGLGRLTTVTENGISATTSYVYDALDSLRTVTPPDGSSVRTFAYDSIKRLSSATNPESGQTTYGYDNNGNLLNRTDAIPVTTSYTYDPLNRITNKSYSDGHTPPVTYIYFGFCSRIYG